MFYTLLLYQNILNYGLNILNELRKNNINCGKLWSIFDDEIKRSDEIECIYDKNSKEYCDICSDKLIIGEDGFVVCVNQKCGIIYKNILLTFLTEILSSQDNTILLEEPEKALHASMQIKLAKLYCKYQT